MRSGLRLFMNARFLIPSYLNFYFASNHLKNVKKRIYHMVTKVLMTCPLFVPLFRLEFRPLRLTPNLCRSDLRKFEYISGSNQGFFWQILKSLTRPRSLAQFQSSAPTNHRFFRKLNGIRCWWSITPGSMLPGVLKLE